MNDYTENKYTWDDIVIAKPGAAEELRPGQRAWVVGMSSQEKRKGSYLEKFPEGWVYTIEFEDGSSTEAAESDLILFREKKNDD